MSNNWYILVESVRNTFDAGGVVMLPILVAGVIGFYFLYASWFRIGSDFFKKDVGKVVSRLHRDLDKGGIECANARLVKRRGILSREFRYALTVAEKTPLEFRNYMQVRMIMTVRYMEQGSRIVAVMAAAAPLLGLLGTVTGMVSTFDVITLYGNQNPVLMADGISEALISTQSGLLIAFPLTLLKQRLDERIELLKQQLELGATVIENFINRV